LEGVTLIRKIKISFWHVGNICIGGKSVASGSYTKVSVVARGMIGYKSTEWDRVMCEVGETDSWRERESNVEVSIG